MKTLNILFLGGAKRVSFAEHLIETGAKRDYDVHIYSYELDPNVPIGKVGEVILGLKWNDTKIYEDLVRIIKEKNIHVVLPFVDKAIEVASELKKYTNIFIPVSSRELCEVMYDKVTSARWFKSKQIPQPKVYDSNNICFPAILKPRKGSASKGIIIALCEKDIENIELENYLIQQYISNAVEYTVDCYVSQTGKPTSIVPRQRLETAGGEVTKTITKREPLLTELSTKILQSGEFRGPITIQFITEKGSEDFYVMEINPRFGGGVIASIEANSHTLEMLLDEYEGKEIIVNKDWKENILMTRYMKEVIYASNY